MFRIKIIRIFTAVLLVGVIPYSFAGSIAIKVSDISDLTNYLNDPLFTPYFEAASTTMIDFEGPWSPPSSGNHVNLGSVGSTYNNLGIEFGPGDTFMGGQPGFGYITPTTVIGNAGSPYDGPISIDVVVPNTATPFAVTSIGAFVADGPTNDTTASFYDLKNNLLGTVTADPNFNMFLGWSDPQGISRVIFTNSGGDDYFIDNLTFSAVPIPPAAWLFLSGFAVIHSFRKQRSFKLN